MRFLISPLILLALASCSSPDSTFKNSCTKMVKDAEDMDRTEQREFCACLTQETSPLNSEAKKTLSKLMKSTPKSKNFPDKLERAIKEEKMTLADGQLMFSAMKGCSIDLAM